MADWTFGDYSISTFDVEQKAARLSEENDVVVITPEPGAQYRFEIGGSTAHLAEIVEAGCHVHSAGALEAAAVYLVRKRGMNTVFTKGDILLAELKSYKREGNVAPRVNASEQ